MSRKKTHEEYVKELSIKNPNIEVIGEYIDSKTKISHKCLIHNEVWEVTPNDILSGRSCHKCKIDKIKMQNTKSSEKYIEELKEKNPYVIVLDSYISAKAKIKHKCLIHNIVWEVAPQDVLRGNGCIMCWRERQGFAKRKSEKQYISELSIKNPNIKMLGKYSGTHTPILHHCNVHNIDWEIEPASVLLGRGCKECTREKISSSNLKTHEEYKNELSIKIPYFSVLEPYLGITIPIMHKCNMHQENFIKAPMDVIRGRGCSQCTSEKIALAGRKTNEQYVEDIKKITTNIIPIDEYITAAIPIKHKCLICGNIWEVKPNNILSGNGCPKCIRSLGEEQIKKWLDDNGIKNEPQFKFMDCKDSRPLPFDFYLPDQNKCIEYDGEQHYKPIDFYGGEEAFKQRVLHDKIKTDYCKENNIPLLRIPYNANIEEELNKFLLI